MRVALEELDAESFAPFGRVIERPERDADASGPGWDWWGETLFAETDGRPFGVGYLALAETPLQFDWAERHMRSPELIIPTDGACAVYVAPPDHPEEPARPPPSERFRAFRVDSGRGVVLEPGVWHGAPLALGGPLTAMVLLLEGTGRSDTSVVRFPDSPIRIQR